MECENAQTIIDMRKASEFIITVAADALYPFD
jgi:hypothetical protein